MGALVASFLQHTAGPCLSCGLHECFLTLSPHHEGLYRALSVPLFAPVAISFSSTSFDFFNWTNSSLACLPTEHIINELEVLLCELVLLTLLPWQDIFHIHCQKYIASGFLSACPTWVSGLTDNFLLHWFVETMLEKHQSLVASVRAYWGYTR